MQKLSNGLTVILKEKDCVGTTVQVTINTGSVDENEGQKGFSHLVEHLIFEGTKKRPTAKVITSEIENLGGEFNASTSNESTQYYVKILGKHTEVALELLSDIILNSTFDQFEKEKGVVLEEIKMLNDNPRYYQWILFENNLFKGTQYEFPVYGFEEDLKEATQQDLLDYYKKHYVPNNAIVTVVGKIEPELIKKIEELFGSWEGSVEKIENTFPHNEERQETKERDVQQNLSVFGVVTPGLLSEDAPVIEVIEAILGKPQSGVMVDEVRNKRGLAYDINVSFENFKKFGFFAVNVGCDTKKQQEVEEIILQELDNLQNISEEEISHAKSYIEGKLSLEIEDSHRYAEFLTFWHQIAGEDKSEEYMKKIFNVKKEDIQRVSKDLFQKMTKISLVPKVS